MIEWEGILRVRNESQVKMGKITVKKNERAGWCQNRVGEGNGKIWDVKYKSSEDLEVKLKNCDHHPTLHQWGKTDKDGERMHVF